MKYLFFLILSLSIFSCKKFECQTCIVQVESNMEYIRAKCNNQPRPDIVSTIDTIETCNEAEYDRIKDREGERTKVFCLSDGPGLFGLEVGKEVITVDCKPIN